MAEEFKVSLGIELESGALDNLRNQIDGIKPNPIKLTLDTSNVTSQINTIKNQIQGLSRIKINLSGNGSGSGGGSNAVNAITKSYRELLSMAKQISNLEIKIGSLKTAGGNTNQIAVLEGQLKSLQNTYEQLMNTFARSESLNSSRLDIGDLSNLQAAVDKSKEKLSELDAKVADTKAKLAESITAKFDTGTFSNEISKVTTDFDNLRVKGTEITTAMTELKTAFANLNIAKQSGDVNSIVRNYETYKTALQNVKNQIDINTRAEREMMNIEKLNSAKTALSSQIDVWLKNNSAAAKQFGSQIEQIKAQIQSADSASLNNLKSQFQEVTRQAELAGKATQSFGDRLKMQLSKLGTYFSATMLITQSIRALKSMYDNVLDVDTAMTELYRVTDMSSSQYNKLYDNMTNSAQKYGATLDSIINSTASWVRLGFNPNDANRLAEITAMYQHVTDLDESTAVNNLVTAYKGYEKQLLELNNGDSTAAVEMIADIYDKLGNEFAESAADVGDGLSKSASVLAQGGASLQEAAGMFTGIQEVLQDSSTSGTALKILTLRIRGMKGELEELGEEVDENIDSISKVQTQVLNLTHGDVNIFDDEGNFRNIYEIMSDISDIYYELSETDRASLLEIIAGKNRANAVQALIDNWDNVEKATEAAYNSAGTAQQEQDIWMNSLESHLKNLSTAWQTFSNDFLSSDFLKNSVSVLTGIVKALDKMVNTFGTLGTIAIGNGFFQLFRNSGYFKTLISSLAQSTISFSNFGAAAKMAGSDLLAFMKTPTGVATAIGLVTAAISLGIQAYRNYKQAQREAWNSQIETGQAARQEIEQIESLYQAYYDAKDAYETNAGSKDSLINATSDLLTALGYEGETIDTLTEKYGNLDNAINQVTIDSLTQKLDTLQEGYTGAKNALLDITKDGNFIWEDNYFDSFSLMDWMEDTQEFGTKMGKILEDAGLISRSNYNQGGALYLGDTNTIEGVTEAYEKLIAMRQALNDAVKNGVLTADELAGSDLYQSILEKLGEFETEYQEYEQFVTDMNETQAKINVFDSLNSNGIPKTKEEFDSLRQSIIDASESGGAFVGTQEQIISAIDNVLGSTPSLTQFVTGYADTLEEVGKITDEQIDELKSKFANDIISDWFENLSDDDKKLVYEIGVKSDDTTLYTLTRWKTELQAMKDTGKTTGEQIQEFYDIVNDTEDGSFSDYVDSYTSSLSDLQDALSKIDTGSLTNAEKVDLAMNFPELAPYINDTDALKNAIQDLVNTSNQDMNDYINQMIEALAETAPEAAEALAAVRDALNGLSSDSNGWDFNLEDEITKFDNLYGAMKESVSATGLTTQSIKNVKSMFQDLDGYDPSKLFERTANGIHLNTKELRNLQSEYEKQKKSEINEHLKDLVDDYNNLSKEIATCTDAQERASKISQLEGLQEEITATADLAAQYEGLTSAYNKWIQAQSSGEEGDMYDSMRDSFDDIQKMYKEGLVGTNAFRTYVDLLSNQDLSTASVDEVIAAYEKLNQTIQGTSYTAIDFLADGSDGCLNFLHAVQDLNSDWAKMNSDGSWEINFGVGNDKEIADALGIDVEYVQSLMRKLSDYGFDINLDSAFTELDKLGTYAEQANEKLKELGKTDIDFNFNSDSIDDINSQITQAQELLDTFKNTDGTVNTKLEGAEEAEAVLIGLITRKQELNQPSVMSVDTSNANSNIETTIGLLKDFQTNYNDIEIETAVGADTSEAQTNIQNVLTSIDSMPDEVKTSLGLDDTAFQTALTTLTSTNVDVKAGVNLDPTALATVQSTISAISPEMMVKAGLDSSLIDGYEPPDKANEVKYSVNDSDVQKYTAPKKTGTVTYTAHMNSWTAPTKYGTVIYTVKTVGKSPSNGTANSFGIGLSNGTAFAKGSWGAKDSGVALGGEVAPELVVRDGKFFTIGDNGAEFFQYKKDDIIFNAGQTAQIFKYGKIKNGKKRGDVFAQGNAFVEGTAFSSGTGRITSSGKTKTTGSKKSTGSSKSSSKSSSSSSDEFEETFDWIEVAIDRIERAISRLDLKVSSIYKSWGSRNENLSKEIGKISEEINIQQKAYDRYIQQAKSTGLSSAWAEKVRNGTIDISIITDEDLADKIKEYQEWYEKALDCQNAIDELNESLAELYETAFNNVSEKYDGILSIIEHEKNMLEEYISQSEEKGYITSVKYYEALMENERKSITQLEKERTEMLKKLQEAMASGKIEHGSQSWYEMVNAIDEVTLSIEQANTAIIEYGNSIREIEWEIFDLLQDKISQLTTESEFLINLMSNDNLYDDKGQLTNSGIATMGLHGQNYNVYMAQAEQYAKEILNIDKELANDPYNQDLIERRQELLELQQDFIVAAEDEKEAIRDMVQEGIELELDALQELIDTYTKALDAQKDLYNYQKKVAEQTKEIASIQKQLSAYAGDTSEETRATVQKLQVSLAEAQENLDETEYEQYISDQKELLDELYNEYETILNQRLDNLEVLIQDMIGEINANANLISTTLSEKADSVGYTLSESMTTIWDTNSTKITTVLTTYGQNIQNGISSAATTVNAAIGTINTNLSTMITQLNNIANTKAQAAKQSSASNSSQAKPSTPSTPKPSTPSKPSTPKTGSGNGKAEVGDKVKYNSGIYYEDSYGGGRHGSHNRGGSVYITKIHKGSPYPYHISTGKRLGSGDLGWLKLSQISGYATGVKNLPNSELAWTQEGNKEEYIIRKSDGAILTPIAKKGSVLNHEASGNIWNMANNPSDFIRDNLDLGATQNIPNIGSSQNIYNQNLENVVFNFPNIKNYEQLLREMQKDKKFEKLILSMTIDRVAGKSSLSKRNAIR